MKKKRNVFISEINIAPFTDIMLVLLIIFMIATPIMFTNTSHIKVNLPKTQSHNNEPIIHSSIEVLISKDKKIYIDGKEVEYSHVKNVMDNFVLLNDNNTVILKCDKSIDYEYVIRFIELAKKSGITKFALAVNDSN
ncbi:MAG: biopolymer transporter ExbD [Endomicrobium sp.]|jgi:biopolymer transport protein ExbD|nr:biopolymer transporter ExbD [Endomicrobium sp.]